MIDPQLHESPCMYLLLEVDEGISQPLYVRVQLVRLPHQLHTLNTVTSNIHATA